VLAAAWAQDAQTPPAQAPPAQQPPTLRPAQTPPAQTPPTQTPAPQTPPTQTTAPEQTPAAQTPPAPTPRPTVPDVRMPGEAGWDVGVLGWFPTQHPIIDKGKAADFTASSRATFAGKPKIAYGADIGIAAGRHNQLRIYYYEARAAGNFTAPNDLVLWTQAYSQGDLISSNYRMQNVKISFEYLTWPFPVETRHFRLKTLWQAQYFTIRNGFDAPLKPTTDAEGNPLTDETGNALTYATSGSRSIVYPSLGIGVQEYAGRHFRLEANVSGFAFPHRSTLWDADASANIRAGHIELRFGARAFHFKTSPRAEFFNRGTFVAPFVGLRWYSD
jgi:hypothetical protein